MLTHRTLLVDTEIDWVAYMEQISQFVSGERDYTKMEGGTGPLVYPAAHVYTYTGLYYLTDRGEDLLLAQQLFAVLYMATLAVVMLCYWKAKVRRCLPSFIACCHSMRVCCRNADESGNPRSLPTFSRY